MVRLPRYGIGARCYDVLSAEPVYRPGRLRGIAGLRLSPGMRVLDIGCGTGLNLALLAHAVGPDGTVIGMDSSAAMLARAYARVARNGWANVRLIRGDGSAPAGLVDRPVDAVLWTYSLSIIDDWRSSWEQGLELTRPGGRLAVVDLAMPRGRGLPAWPLARLACFTGGVNLRRSVWRVVTQQTTDSEHHVLRAGHIHVAAGTRP